VLNVDATAQNKLAQLLGNRDIYDDEIANWADGYRITHPETGGFHFIDIPHNKSSIDPSKPYAQNCILQKLTHEIQVLGDDTESNERRIEAIKWVVHLTGDIHQPLHCADRNNDAGGNACKVKYPGLTGKQKLHKVWDTLLLEEGLGDAELQDYATTLNQNKPSDLTTAIGDFDLQEWALESHAIAKDNSYKDIPATNGTITAAYVQTNVPVVKLQLQRAGVRLAGILNLALGGVHPALHENFRQAAALRTGATPQALIVPVAQTDGRAVRQLRAPIELRD
jgi:hypothetical protein